MPKTLHRPNEMTALAYKDYVSIVSRPFMDKTVGDTLLNIIRAATYRDVDLAQLMDKLSGSSFAEQLVTKCYGDIRRSLPKIEKTLIPNVLFDFIDDALSRTNITVSEDEAVFIKMLHLAIFSSWGAVINQAVPTNVTNYSKLTPDRKGMVTDMIRVFRSKDLVNFKVKELPKDRTTAPIIVDALLTVYAELAVEIVAVDNTARKVDAVLGAIVLWINDSLIHSHIVNNQAFQSLVNNMSLIRMALKHFTVDTVPRTVLSDSYFLDMAIKDMSEYLRSEQSDIRVYRVAELAATHNVHRFINQKSKFLKGVLVAPNFDDIKFIQWFHKRIGVGNHYVRLISSADPTSMISAAVSTLDHKFFANELLRAMGDISQHMVGDGVATEFFKAPDGDDFLIYAALVRSEQVRVDVKSIEYVYKMDDQISIDSHSLASVKTDVGQLARTTSAMAVCAMSGKQPTDYIPFPLRKQTVEDFATSYLLPKNVEVGKALDNEYKFKDSYRVEGEDKLFSKPTKLSDIVFSGTPVSLVNVAFSPVLKDILGRYVASLHSKILMADSLPHIKLRIANNVWLAIKSFEKTTDFGYHAANYRHFHEIPIDPMRVSDAARNLIQSNLAMVRILLNIGTGVSEDVMSTFFQTVFNGTLDSMSIISESEIARIAG